VPRYVYHCDICDGNFQVRHGMKDMQETCQICSETGHLSRIPQMPIVKKESTTRTNSIGSVTKDYIEQNRELLQSMKKEARNQQYDD
jgi:hypothetical protein